MAGIRDSWSEEACKWTAPQYTPNYLKTVGSDASLLVCGEVRSDATMLWTAATMCFFGFLKGGEIVAHPDSLRL